MLFALKCGNFFHVGLMSGPWRSRQTTALTNVASPGRDTNSGTQTNRERKTQNMFDTFYVTIGTMMISGDGVLHTVLIYDTIYDDLCSASRHPSFG